MTKYLETFESETIGVQPTNWTERWDGADVSWVVGDDGGSPSDQYVRATATATGRKLLSYDSVVASDRTDGQFLMRFRINEALNYFGAVIRGDGAASTEDGYAFYVRASTSVLTVTAYVGGSSSSYVANPGVTVTTGAWFWLRGGVFENELYLKVWADGDPEPNWQLRETDDTVSIVGSAWAGLFMFASSGTADCSLFSVGTGSDPADLPGDEVGVRTTQATAHAVNALDAQMRVTQATAQVVNALNDDARVTQVAALSLWGGLSDGVRVTQEAVLVLAYGTPCFTRWTQAWTITRVDGTVFRFTTLDVDFVYGGNTYLTCGALASTASENSMGLTESGNVEISAILNSSHIKDQEVLAGLFDGATVSAWVIPWEAQQGEIPFRLMYGEIGGITKGTAGFTAEVLTYAARAQQVNLLDTYTSSCRHTFGDSGCKVDASALLVSGTVTTLASPNQPNVSKKRAFIDTSRGEAAGYFNYGKITWVTGNNAGSESQIETFDTGAFLLWDITAYAIEIGDQYTATPGCDKTTDTCKNTYSNFTNFGGFPHVPGEDRLLGWSVKPNEVL